MPSGRRRLPGFRSSVRRGRMVMAMNVKWNNLVARSLMLVLVALFGAPCTACDDGVSHVRCPHTLGTVQVIHGATSSAGCKTCETPRPDAPPCQCLSDASKVRSYRSQTTQVNPDATFPAVSTALSDPPLVPVSDSWQVPSLPSLLLHPAAAGRAPPAV